MNRRLTLLAGAAFLAGGQALAQTEQQRAQAAQGQTGGQAGSLSQTPTPSPSATANRAEVVTGAEFSRMAAMSDRFEIASSRLAEQKSQNAEIKQFAQHMIRDHEKTSQELQVLMPQVQGTGAGVGSAYPQGREPTGSGAMVSVQGGPQSDRLDQQHAALLQQLQQASGAEFDRLYVRQQITAHQQAVDMFRNYSQSGDNAQLKQWTAKTLPALQEHLQMAQRLQQATLG
jgi:putative membrane protein